MLPLAITIALLIGCFAILFWRLASRFDAQHCTAEWLDQFTLSTYTPMQRLLDRKDLAFLAAQPGYRPEISSRLIAERRKIFRSYLRMLVRDFNQLIRIGKLMVVYSTHDQTEFARSLLRQQVKFYVQVSMLHVQSTLYPWAGITVDAQGLLSALGDMRNQVRQLASPGPALGQMA
jgi:hypothetical protein